MTDRPMGLPFQRTLAVLVWFGLAWLPLPFLSLPNLTKPNLSTRLDSLNSIRLTDCFAGHPLYHYL